MTYYCSILGLLIKIIAYKFKVVLFLAFWQSKFTMNRDNDLAIEGWLNR